MSNSMKRALAALGAAALLAPAAAAAKPPAERGHGKPDRSERVAAKGHDRDERAARGRGRGKGHAKPKQYVFKGTVAAVSGSEVVVTVTGGNKRARAFQGDDVTFDATGAKVVVADVDGNGAAELADVQAGDRVVVKSRLPRGVDASAQPFAARKVVDLTAPPADEDEDEDGTDGATEAPAESGTTTS